MYLHDFYHHIYDLDGFDGSYFDIYSILVIQIVSHKSLNEEA